MGTGTTFVLCASLNLSPVPLLMQDPRTPRPFVRKKISRLKNELNGGEVFDFYDTELQVRAISVPGHTPGSIVYSVQTTWEDDSPATLLFTGDALFPGGVGKTDSPAQFGELFSNVLEKLFGNFDDEAIVLPGHGRSTTLGTERPHLEEWGSRGW